ncbi:hypothetical protein SNEBB_009155 [Seison nebaliae]|nr:hypothetical protein SNEBB_009155 [Seison nebaliae]
MMKDQWIYRLALIVVMNVHLISLRKVVDDLPAVFRVSSDREKIYINIFQCLIDEGECIESLGIRINFYKFFQFTSNDICIDFEILVQKYFMLFSNCYIDEVEELLKVSKNLKNVQMFPVESKKFNCFNNFYKKSKKNLNSHFIHCVWKNSLEVIFPSNLHTANNGINKKNLKKKKRSETITIYFNWFSKQVEKYFQLFSENILKSSQFHLGNSEKKLKKISCQKWSSTEDFVSKYKLESYVHKLSKDKDIFTIDQPFPLERINQKIISQMETEKKVKKNLSKVKRRENSFRKLKNVEKKSFAVIFERKCRTILRKENELLWKYRKEDQLKSIIQRSSFCQFGQIIFGKRMCKLEEIPKLFYKISTIKSLEYWEMTYDYLNRVTKSSTFDIFTLFIDIFLATYRPQIDSEINNDNWEDFNKLYSCRYRNGYCSLQINEDDMNILSCYCMNIDNFQYTDLFNTYLTSASIIPITNQWEEIPLKEMKILSRMRINLNEFLLVLFENIQDRLYKNRISIDHIDYRYYLKEPSTLSQSLLPLRSIFNHNVYHHPFVKRLIYRQLFFLKSSKLLINWNANNEVLFISVWWIINDDQTILMPNDYLNEILEEIDEFKNFFYDTFPKEFCALNDDDCYFDSHDNVGKEELMELHREILINSQMVKMSHLMLTDLELMIHLYRLNIDDFVDYWMSEVTLSKLLFSFHFNEIARYVYYRRRGIKISSHFQRSIKKQIELFQNVNSFHLNQIVKQSIMKSLNHHYSFGISVMRRKRKKKSPKIIIPKEYTSDDIIPCYLIYYYSKHSLNSIMALSEFYQFHRSFPHLPMFVRDIDEDLVAKVYGKSRDIPYVYLMHIWNEEPIGMKYSGAYITSSKLSKFTQAITDYREMKSEKKFNDFHDQNELITIYKLFGMVKQTINLRPIQMNRDPTNRIYEILHELDQFNTSHMMLQNSFEIPIQTYLTNHQLTFVQEKHKELMNILTNYTEDIRLHLKDYNRLDLDKYSFSERLCRYLFNVYINHDYYLSYFLKYENVMQIVKYSYYETYLSDFNSLLFSQNVSFEMNDPLLDFSSFLQQQTLSDITFRKILQNQIFLNFTGFRILNIILIICTFILISWFVGGAVG